MRLQLSIYPNGPNVSDEWRGGIRFRFDLGSTCNRQFKKAQQRNKFFTYRIRIIKAMWSL